MMLISVDYYYQNLEIANTFICDYNTIYVSNAIRIPTIDLCNRV